MILFNIIRAMPVKPTFYAVGPVDSIALSVFLGADTRFCSPFCRFLIHEVTFAGAIQGTLTHSQMIQPGMMIESQRNSLLEVLQSRGCFPREDFKTTNLIKEARIIDPASARKERIVQEIKDAVILPGVQFINIEL
jgi:ATP-dependent protease ClpP protease subunit